MGQTGAKLSGFRVGFRKVLSASTVPTMRDWALPLGICSLFLLAHVLDQTPWLHIGEC